MERLCPDKRYQLLRWQERIALDLFEYLEVIESDTKEMMRWESGELTKQTEHNDLTKTFVQSANGRSQSMNDRS